jgi:hypothetical protein
MPAVSAPLSSTQIGSISITYLPDGIHHVRPLAQYDGADDVDPSLSRETKASIERELAQPDTVTVGAHFPNLVFGRVLPGAVPLSIDFSLSKVLS